MERKTTATFSTLDRTFDFLEILGSRSEPMSASEISAAMGITKTTVYSMLNSLMRKYYVVRVEKTGKYKIGPVFYKYGQVYSHGLEYFRSPAICSFIAQTEERLSQKWRANAHTLFAAENHEVYSTHFINPYPSTLSHTLLGGVGAYALAAGRVILAHYSEVELEHYLNSHELIAYTPDTVTDKEQLKAELAIVRENNYAVVKRSIDPDISCVAVPVYDAHGKVNLALSITFEGLEMQKVDAELPAILSDLKIAAKQLSAQFGYNFVHA